MGHQKDRKLVIWDTNIKIQEVYGISGENVLAYGLSIKSRDCVCLQILNHLLCVTLIYNGDKCLLVLLLIGHCVYLHYNAYC